MPKHFIDSNVLIYSIDETFPDKRVQAIELIACLAESGEGVISTQVLQEFYAVATKKLGVVAQEAKQHVRDFQIFEVVTVNTNLIEQAIDCSILSQISFWDALIVRAAAESGCDVLYSEDLSDSQIIDGVKIQNPFA